MSDCGSLGVISLSTQPGSISNLPLGVANRYEDGRGGRLDDSLGEAKPDFSAAHRESTAAVFLGPPLREREDIQPSHNQHGGYPHVSPSFQWQGNAPVPGPHTRLFSSGSGEAQGRVVQQANPWSSGGSIRHCLISCFLCAPSFSPLSL